MSTQSMHKVEKLNRIVFTVQSMFYQKTLDVFFINILPSAIKTRN